MGSVTELGYWDLSKYFRVSLLSILHIFRMQRSAESAACANCSPAKMLSFKPWRWTLKWLRPMLLEDSLKLQHLRPFFVLQHVVCSLFGFWVNTELFVVIHFAPKFIKILYGKGPGYNKLRS